MKKREITIDYYFKYYIIGCIRDVYRCNFVGVIIGCIFIINFRHEQFERVITTPSRDYPLGFGDCIVPTFDSSVFSFPNLATTTTTIIATTSITSITTTSTFTSSFISTSVSSSCCSFSLSYAVAFSTSSSSFYAVRVSLLRAPGCHASTVLVIRLDRIGLFPVDNLRSTRKCFVPRNSYHSDFYVYIFLYGEIIRRSVFELFVNKC